MSDPIARRMSDPAAHPGLTIDRPALARAVADLLRALGEDPDREGLRRTPERVAEMYAEIFGGLAEDPGALLEGGFDEQHEEMVVLRDIRLQSVCEHHLLPFIGTAHVGYIPRGRVVGIDKIARAVDILARRPQVQERLTSQIADLLDRRLEPRGVAVILSAEHLCYDRLTEVLTPEGWVPFDRFDPTTPVAQVDVTSLAMSFVVASDFVRYRHDGSMVRLRSDSVDLVVTPDHRMVHLGEWEFEHHHGDRGWRVAPARSLPARFYVPQACVTTTLDTESVALGRQDIDGDDYARFMALWLAEGCTRASKGDVVISQDDGPFASEIRTLLARLPFGFREVRQTGLRANHIQFKSSFAPLYADLAPLGKSGDKRVPRLIMGMSARQIDLFLDWYAMGDGHRYRRNPLRVQYVSKSHGMIDDIQELLLRVGKTGGIQRYSGCSRIEVRTHTRAAGKGYKWYGKLLPRHRNVEPFDDEVFCVSVPTGAILVRRNGKPVVSGNCMSMRGLRVPGSRVVTSATRGAFRTRDATRLEFLALLKDST